jgi:hypothetical protein
MFMMLFERLPPLKVIMHSCNLHDTPLVTAQIFDNDMQVHEFTEKNVHLSHSSYAIAVQSQNLLPFAHSLSSGGL